MSRRRPSVGRTLGILLALGSLVALGGVAVAMVLDGTVTRQSVDGLTTGGEQPAQPDLPELPDEVRYVLVAGLDDRSVLSAEERRELSTGDAEGARTEALAVVRVDPDADRVDVLRLPRDLLVTRCDGSRGRINAAYGIGEREGRGGATCLVETITSWTGLPLHHVVEIDFRGFVDLIEAVDGVTIELDEPLHDRRAGLDLPAGTVELDGADALAFVRARGMDDDLGRIERQQQLVAAALDQVASARTLTDPARLTSLVRTAQRHLTFDDQMTARELLRFARLAAERDADDLETRTVPGTVDRSDGPWFLRPDEVAAQALFADLRDGGFTEPAPVVSAEAEDDQPSASDGGSPPADG